MRNTFEAKGEPKIEQALDKSNVYELLRFYKANSYFLRNHLTEAKHINVNSSVTNILDFLNSTGLSLSKYMYLKQVKMDLLDWFKLSPMLKQDWKYVIQDNQLQVVKHGTDIFLDEIHVLKNMFGFNQEQVVTFIGYIHSVDDMIKYLKNLLNIKTTFGFKIDVFDKPKFKNFSQLEDYSYFRKSIIAADSDLIFDDAENSEEVERGIYSLFKFYNWMKKQVKKPTHPNHEFNMARIMNLTKGSDYENAQCIAYYIGYEHIANGLFYLQDYQVVEDIEQINANYYLHHILGGSYENLISS